MNEEDRAAFYEAEEDLMNLDLAPELLDEIEDLWLSGSRHTATNKLSNSSGMDPLMAYDLLKRVYDGA